MRYVLVALLIGGCGEPDRLAEVKATWGQRAGVAAPLVSQLPEPEPTPVVEDDGEALPEIAEVPEDTRPIEGDVVITTATWCRWCHVVLDELFGDAAPSLKDGETAYMRMEVKETGEVYWFRVVCDDNVRSAPKIHVHTKDGLMSPNGNTWQDRAKNCIRALEKHGRKPGIRYPEDDHPLRA